VTEHRPRIGVVGLPGRWSTDHLAEVVTARVGAAPVIDLARVELDLARDRCRQGDLDLLGFDALLVKKLDEAYSPWNFDRIEVLRYLERRGVRIFSSPEKVARLINRLSCTVELGLAGIPMPETLATEDLDAAVDAIVRFEGAVLKPLYSTKARGMRLVATSDRDEVRREVEAFRAEGNGMMYIQRRVPMPDRDLGVVFIGDRYLTTYARVKGDGAWNTTTRSGGHYAREDVDEATIELARRARDLFDLDFTVVDVVRSEVGTLVFEVSAFGGFRGIHEGCGIDAAGEYVDHVLGRLREGSAR
jgi:tetrahydromethanopterin:alpha-L-glutamate ligase